MEAGKIKDFTKGLYATIIGPFYQQPVEYLDLKEIDVDEIAKKISDVVGSDRVRIIALRKSLHMPWDMSPVDNPLTVKNAFEYLMNESVEADVVLTGIHVCPAVFGFKEKGYGIFGDSEGADEQPVRNVIGIDVIPYKE